MLSKKSLKNIITVSGLLLAAVSFSHANIHADMIRVNQLPVDQQNQTNVQTNVQENQSQSSNQNITYKTQTHRQKQFQKLYRVAHSKLGDRYAYGATGPNSFDCSGFTQYVYKHGIHKNIPRNAEAQRHFSKRVSYKHAKPGDLVFFGYHVAGHVGLYLGKDKMIDAQNRGVIIEHVHAPWWHILGFGRILK